jgi:hypothetical protein
MPLVEFGASLGYDITVVDDRPSFVNIERFPLAEQVICDSFENCFNNVMVDISEFRSGSDIVAKGISNLNISLVFYILNLFLVGLGAYYFGDALEVLFGSYVPHIFKIGILVYAVPSYFIIIKNDLKKYLNSNQIK